MSGSRRAVAGQPANSFGARLRGYREAAGLTQEALAERAGLSLNAIGALERGDRRHPYPSTVRVLADALGIPEQDRAALTALLPKRAGRGPWRDPVQSESLPIPATVLLGREREVEAAVELLKQTDVRLLTLTGPGGVGKTRLALRVTMEVGVGDAFADGAQYVALASLTDPQLVPAAIMQGLALQDGGETEPLDILVSSLRDRHLLLVLDNFEQVAAAAPAVADLLRTCPTIKVMVTSRLSLRVDGEREFPVSPLALPTGAASMPLAELAELPAVALFMQRARAVRPDIALTAENAQAIVELCAALDGLPLAIELAAARSRLLSPQAMLRLLEHRLGLLTGGGLDRPVRLQTMREAIRWSYNLLAPDDQVLFRRLSVFAGGATLDAIETMFGLGASSLPGSNRHLDGPASLWTGGAVLDGAARLVDHSLLLREEEPDGSVRVGMLETIREFGHERLVESGELDAVRQAHAAWFLDVATTAREDIEGPDRRSAHERVRRELDNLRGALAWLHATGDAETAQNLAIEMARFWIDLGYINEGRGWVERVVAMPGSVSPGTRAELLYWASELANLQDASAQAAMFAGQALEIARADNNLRGIAMALTGLGEAVATTDLERGEALVAEALATFRKLGEPVREGISLGQLGKFAHRRGDYELAASYHETALVIWRRLDHPWGIPSSLRDLAGETLVQGDLATAWAMYQESLTCWQRLGEPIHMSDCLSGLARVALAAEWGEVAATLLGAEDALNGRTGYLPFRAGHAALVDATIAALGREAFDAAWARGRSLSLETVIDEVLTLTAPPAS